jgi:hypothetical protein
VRGGAAFYRNAIILFSLIDNVSVINCVVAAGASGNQAAYRFTYTREAAEKLVGEDMRRQAGSAEDLRELINKVQQLALGGSPVTPDDVAGQVEAALEIIMSSPKTSSNPADYLAAHPDDVKEILKLGDQALDYLLGCFAKDGENDLRGYIMMALCQELLGARANVADDTLPPREWYSALSLRAETELPDYVYRGNDPIAILVYATETAQNSRPQSGFTVVACHIFWQLQ